MTYKKIIALVAIIGSSFSAMAQNNEGVSISETVTPPDPSAMLDVQADNKGVLIPRVSLNSIQDNTTVANPIESLLLYNTNANIISGCGKGFYYWTGSRWEKMGGCTPHMTFQEMIALTSSLGTSDIDFEVYVTTLTVSVGEALGYNSTCSQQVSVQGLWRFTNTPMPIHCSILSTVKWAKDVPLTNTSCSDQSPNPSPC